MMIRDSIMVGDKPTKEQLEQVKLASAKPILYDDDCPELTAGQIKAFECAARQRNHIKSGQKYKTEKMGYCILQ